MFKILIFFWIFLLLISIFYLINNLMQKKENFNVSEVENDINSRNKIYLQTNVIDIIPGKPGPKGDEGNKGEDGTKGLSGEDGLIGNSGNDGDDAATVQFIYPDGTDPEDVSVRNTNTGDTHTINIPNGKKGDHGDTRKLNYCYIGEDKDILDCTNESEPSSNDMYLFIPKGLPGELGVPGDCSMESPGFPGPQGDKGPSGDKGEKGPRGLDGKRGIDADKLNIGSNVMGVEYKICFDENNPDNCIDVPMLKAINQDYQDKIDNKPYEDILSNTNNNYVPVLLRRINRLKKDLCLAHLTGDYSNGYITDIEKDLYDTYKAFNEAESNEFEKVRSDDTKLNEYCAKLFNIVTADFVFTKTVQDDCRDVDLYNFIKTNLQLNSKWEDRLNTYKNTPVVDIKFEKGTGIISSSTGTAALIINVDKIFEIFPNIYEIILNVDRFITGKHGPSGAEEDDWEGKEPDKLNGGKGQVGNAGGPAIDIIYDGFKEIVIRINEMGGSGTKIAGGFGSLGGAGGKASKSFTKNTTTQSKKKPSVDIPAKDEMLGSETINYEGHKPGDDGHLYAYGGPQKAAWVSGSRNKNGTTYNYSMIVFGTYHLASSHDESSDIKSENNVNNQFWKFKKGKYKGSDDFNCDVYEAGSNEFIRDRPSQYSGFTFPFNYYIKPKSGTEEYICSSEWSKPKDKARWHDFTAEKWQHTPADTKPGDCESGWIEDPVNTENCCKIDATTRECHINEIINEDGIKFPADHGSHTIGAPANYTAKDKEAWEIQKNANDETPEYVPITIDFTPSETIDGRVGSRGTDGNDGDIISTKIQDKTKVIIFLNETQL